MRERPEAKRGANGKRYDPERLFLPPDDDLAPNRPGETLRARLEASRAGRVGLALARLLGRRPVEDDWRRALAAEQLVGTELDGLTAGGWEVVHSIVLPGDAVISHLLIGPGGVFCVAAEQTRGTRVEVGEVSVRVGAERQGRPYVRRTRHCALRSSLVLSRGCGFPVPVLPVLVLVGAVRVEVDRSLDDVRVLREEEVLGLGELGGVLHPDRVDRIHTVARNRRVWLLA
ncbi:nuclease-related domain-containing protein [Streptomyces sp. NPDC053048]|uniref:nuclease-related domain-containing protein n=1 Tax=Streptomyces sp. NPDC053048 TaxID=3365694 RepID=UPI0037D0AF80